MNFEKSELSGWYGHTMGQIRSAHDKKTLHIVYTHSNDLLRDFFKHLKS